MKKLPVLYHKAKSGKIYEWEIWSEEDRIYTRHGIEDGKQQTVSKKVAQKNVGKTNETTLKEQAELEALSMWKKKKDKKYRETIEGATEEEIILPMLAMDFQKRKKRVEYPCDIQPKLDGVRALAAWADGEVKLLSRGGKEYSCPHITEELSRLMPKHLVLDGEVYSHGEGFQTIVSWAKKLRPETANLKFHVYDCYDKGALDFTWRFRKTVITEWFEANKPITCELLLTETVYHEKGVYDKQEDYVKQGYEGAILRQPNGLYSLGNRSADLLKVKSFDDTEYKIVGFKEGVGKFEKCVIWICESGNDTFDVVPKGTLDEKKEWFINGDSYMGSLLKVKHFGLTDAGLPRIPVGLGIRPPEDL
jgi:DNA ligase-1